MLPRGAARLRPGSRPSSRTARTAPNLGLAARSHSRAASKPRIGRLDGGVLQGVVGLCGIGHLLAVDVQGH
eukprot:10789383-Alexandrium_andersonii.AAC.1